MPGLVAPMADERELLLAFLGQQRDALRYAAHGLDDEQASARPSVSELCLAGLIKHAAQVERAWAAYMTTGDSGVFAPRTTAPTGSGSSRGRPWPTSSPTRTSRPGPWPGWSRRRHLDAALAPTEDRVPWIPAGWCGRRAGCCCT